MTSSSLISTEEKEVKVCGSSPFPSRILNNYFLILLAAAGIRDLHTVAAHTLFKRLSRPPVKEIAFITARQTSLLFLISRARKGGKGRKKPAVTGLWNGRGNRV